MKIVTKTLIFNSGVDVSRGRHVGDCSICLRILVYLHCVYLLERKSVKAATEKMCY